LQFVVLRGQNQDHKTRINLADQEYTGLQMGVGAALDKQDGKIILAQDLLRLLFEQRS